MATPRWRDHPRGQLFPRDVLALTGGELLRAMMERRVADPPLTRLANFRVTDVGLGTCTMAMPATGWWQSAATVFPAGVLAFVADGALGGALMTAASAGVGMMTAEMSLNFLRAASPRSEWMIGRGRVIHSTRSQGLTEAFIDDGRGRLLAHGTSRGLLAPIDLENRPELAKSEDGEPGGEADPHRQEPQGDLRGQEYWNSHDGAEIVQGFIDLAVIPPVFQFTGMRIVAAGEGTATLTMPTSRWLANGYGVFFGGALALFADIALNTAVLTRLPKATSFAPLDLKVNFLRPVLPDSGDVLARAQVMHLGRTVAVVSSELFDARDRPVAVASETILILPGRPWARPVHVAEEVPFDG